MWEFLMKTQLSVTLTCEFLMKIQLSVTLICQFPQQLTSLWWDEDHFSNDQSKQVGRWEGKLSKEKKNQTITLILFFPLKKKMMKKRMTALETWEIW